ncbi:MAG: class I SAM-dependent methyltransferase [Acidimicrobiales bacterium]
MSEPDNDPPPHDTGQVNNAAAAVYGAFFVPALFGQFPDRVLDHAGVGEDAVLDVGCGTGIVARAARARVGPGATVAGIDPNDGMLDVARRSDPSISWHSGRGRVDAVRGRKVRPHDQPVAAMFFVDRVAAIREMAP